MNINWKSREINLKIVYYGPALSGKTTNVEFLHHRVLTERRSEILSLNTLQNRTFYFDFMELELGKISGFKPKIHVYTVPGQTPHEANRRIVLRRADAVIFVCDSTQECLPANHSAWVNLFKNLKKLNLPVRQFPVVVQHNKQDLPDAMPVPKLNELS